VIIRENVNSKSRSPRISKIKILTFILSVIVVTPLILRVYNPDLMISYMRDVYEFPRANNIKQIKISDDTNFLEVNNISDDIQTSKILLYGYKKTTLFVGTIINGAIAIDYIKDYQLYDVDKTYTMNNADKTLLIVEYHMDYAFYSIGIMTLILFFISIILIRTGKDDYAYVTIVPQLLGMASIVILMFLPS